MELLSTWTINPFWKLLPLSENPSACTNVVAVLPVFISRTVLRSQISAEIGAEASSRTSTLKSTASVFVALTIMQRRTLSVTMPCMIG
jgi:hypothetical protein